MNAPLEHVLVQSHQQRKRRRFGAWLLAALLAAGAAHAIITRQSGDQPKIEYVAAEVTRGPLTVTITATGTLQPLTQVDVGSELSGLVEEVLVDYNDAVARDQVLARLDTQRLEASAVQARGSLTAVEAQLQEARATATETTLKGARCAKLALRQMCSADDLDAAQAAQARAEAMVASARAQVAVARATLEERETELAKAVIRSPIDGIVLKRLIEPGQTVAAMMQTPLLFTLAENLTQMELNVAVDEADVGEVTPGLRASFTVDAYPERTFPAVVKQIRYAPETVDGVVTYATLLDVDNADLALRPGMTATAEIVVTEIADAILVPTAALRFTPPPAPDAQADGGGFLGRLMFRFPRRRNGTRSEEPAGNARRVWVLERGVPRAVEVAVGASDTQRTVVSAGALQPGMQVAIDYLQGAP